MIFKSCHGTDNSDIFISDEGYELVRQTLGFEIERVVIIYHGERVHQIQAQEGLAKAMTWCREHNRIPELHFATYCEQQR
jgi:hypothetical protein